MHYMYKVFKLNFSSFHVIPSHFQMMKAILFETIPCGAMDSVVTHLNIDFLEIKIDI